MIFSTFARGTILPPPSKFLNSAALIFPFLSYFISIELNKNFYEIEFFKSHSQILFSLEKMMLSKNSNKF